jgi:hypothetical protein
MQACFSTLGNLICVHTKHSCLHAPVPNQTRSPLFNKNWDATLEAHCNEPAAPVKGTKLQLAFEVTNKGKKS